MSATPLLLVARHNGLGDLLSALPALRALRRAFPRHRIATTCPAYLVPLAAASGVADDYLTEAAPGAGHDPVRHQEMDGVLLDAVHTRATDADVIAVLRVPDRDTTGRLFAVRPRLFLGYQHPELPTTARLPAFDFHDHITARWRRLLRAFGILSRGTDLDIVLPAAAEPPEADAERPPPTIVHIGAAGPARRWPEERWARVATALTAEGHHVVLTGSRAETAAVERVRQTARLPAERNLAGSTDILALARLVAGARLVLSCDTGIAHLAVATRRPSVTLFGPVPPAWWGPPPGRRRHHTLWKGHYGDAYAATPDEGLLAITVDEVLNAVFSHPAALPLAGTWRRPRTPDPER